MNKSGLIDAITDGDFDVGDKSDMIVETAREIQNAQINLDKRLGELTNRIQKLSPLAVKWDDIEGLLLFLSDANGKVFVFRHNGLYEIEFPEWPF